MGTLGEANSLKIIQLRKKFSHFV